MEWLTPRNFHPTESGVRRGDLLRGKVLAEKEDESKATSTIEEAGVSWTLKLSAISWKRTWEVEKWAWSRSIQTEREKESVEREDGVMGLIVTLELPSKASPSWVLK